MARGWHCATCWARPAVSRAAGLLLLVALVSGCAGQKKSTVGLDVDVYLHPTSSDPADILLQAGIARRLAEDSVTRDGIIHVRVVEGVVILSGAVKSDAVRSKAQQIAQETDIRLNGNPIWPDRKINNQIEVQR